MRGAGATARLPRDHDGPTHDYPLSTDSLRELGLTVRTDMPEVYHLMELYPQPVRRQPAKR